MIAFPSILEKTPEELFSQITKLSLYFNYFQVDIADGIFVPNKTVQINELIKTTFNKDSLLLNKRFEFHLMVQDYETNIKKLVELKKYMNIETILIHSSLSPDYQQIIKNYKLFSFGLVLNPEDSVKTIVHNYQIDNIPIIQIMTVDPGLQGNPFLPESLNKVEQLRLANYRNKISLDGAMNDKTIPYILEHKYKPDIVCPGSYLTKTNELEKHVKYLQSLQ